MLLLLHHVFFPERISEYGLKTLIIQNVELANEVALFGKICIAGFAFLSAYGMTRAFKRFEQDNIQAYFSHILKRFLKLEASIIIVYLLAVLYRRFVVIESVTKIYVQDEKNIIKVLLYMLLDMTGLACYTDTPTINVTWWYLSYAILLIAAMPFLYKIYAMYRYLILPIALLLPSILFQTRVSFAQLLPIVFLGVAFAYEDWFEKIRSTGGTKTKVIKFIIGIFTIWVAFLLSENLDIMFAYTLAFIIPYMVFEFIGEVPLVSKVLEFAGKHSMNIFLTHTFIYYYFYDDFIYSFHYSVLIFTVLLLLSLGVSIGIGVIKKVTGYNKLTQWMINQVDRSFAMKK